MTKTDAIDLWNTGFPIRDLPGIESIPEWIEQGITGTTVAAIVQGGCDSGSYTPAVTYHEALTTMGEHGDDVLEAIEEVYGDLPAPPTGTSWGGIASFYLSLAVELWAQGVAAILGHEN